MKIREILWIISAGSPFPNCLILLSPLPWPLFKPPPSLSPSPPSHPQNFFSSTQFLQPHMAAAAMDQTHHQFHVLAVDDSIIDRKLIERLLKTSSYQVTAVDSGSKALEFLGLRSEGNNNDDEASVSPGHDDHNNNQVVGVNMIITDYCMPGMTGYDLLRKIKGSASLKDIPVVIMSSENVPSRINRCLEDGAEEFFLKPVQLSDVNKLRPHLLKRSQEAEPNNCNNKRKGMEEIDSPDRTRTRYNGSD